MVRPGGHAISDQTNDMRARLFSGLATCALLAFTACANESRFDIPGDSGGASSDASTDDAATGSDTTSSDTTNSDTTGTDTAGTDTGATTLPEPDNHRPAEIVCDRERPATEFLPDPDSGETWDCETDADCTDGENGRCSSMPRWGWACTYDSCFEDADCGGAVCGCNADWGSDANRCYSGNCQVNADCGDGGWCSPSYGDCGDYSGVVSYYCRTPDDECLNDSDCNEQTGGYCMFSDPAARWVCSYSHCAG